MDTVAIYLFALPICEAGLNYKKSVVKLSEKHITKT